MAKAETISNRMFIEGETTVDSNATPAFVDALATHESLVFSLAFHMLRDEAHAEDVAQDVFFRLYQDYEKIQGASHLIHWLRRTTIHRCLDLLRRFKKHRQIPLEETNAASSSPQMEEDRILLTTLRRFVAELPANARAVVVLRYQEDLEPREIAHLLDIPVNTVKSRLQRALNALRDRFAAFEESRYGKNRKGS